MEKRLLIGSNSESEHLGFSFCAPHHRFVAGLQDIGSCGSWPGCCAVILCSCGLDHRKKTLFSSTHSTSLKLSTRIVSKVLTPAPASTYGRRYRKNRSTTNLSFRYLGAMYTLLRASGQGLQSCKAICQILSFHQDG